MIDDFILYAFFAVLGISLISGPLGCFIIWRRMAYFGDSLAHSALLGIALGIFYETGTKLSISLVCGAFAILLLHLQNKRFFSIDTLLGIFAHAALSAGIVFISFFENIQINMHSLLFGDILTISNSDLLWIYGIAALILSMIFILWDKLILMIINSDLSAAEGISLFWTNLIFMMMMTLMVAISIQIVGVLLVTSLLIIPAATARILAQTPKQMACFASLLAIFASVIGLCASTYHDAPSGPAIVVSAFMIFSVAWLVISLKAHYKKSFINPLKWASNPNTP
ncbi:MAG: iron chelate uptake ABC transporter family permease subunit [Pseudomonadota bacterium]